MRSLYVGRAKSCDFVIDDPSVSRIHAEIRISGGLITVKDMDSNNGTYLIQKNKKKLVVSAEVDEEDQVYFGDAGPFVVEMIVDGAGEKTLITGKKEQFKAAIVTSTGVSSAKRKRCLECGVIMRHNLKTCPECGARNI